MGYNGCDQPTPFGRVTVEIQQGDRLLLFSAGVTEIHDSKGENWDIDGFVTLLNRQGYPPSQLDMNALEKALLQYSNTIRLDDDLTVIEVRITDL